MKFWTYKSQVPLGPNQHIGFIAGKGYFAAEGNPSPFPHPSPPKPVPLTVREQMLHWARWGVLNQAHFSYTQSNARREMFHRRPGDTSGVIHADCSQFYASIGHWCGIKVFTDYDYTGTLLVKGRLVKVGKPADCVIFGPGTGVHASMFDYDTKYTIGFGHSPGAPNRQSIAEQIAYFAKHGHPGVRYLSFTP